jgi:hypothetical protein
MRAIEKQIMQLHRFMFVIGDTWNERALPLEKGDYAEHVVEIMEQLKGEAIEEMQDKEGK